VSVHHHAPTSRHAETVTLLGPQRALTNQTGPASQSAEHLRDLLKSDGVKGRLAVVTAGWQERESEDQAFIETLGVPCINLRLHQRSEEVFAEDGEFARAYKARQERLRHMQSFYRTRLEAADDAAHAIAVRHVDEALLEEELGVSIEVFRQLDRDHVERCSKVYSDFDAHWMPVTRPAVVRHWRELQEILSGCQALFIAGGHVASLYNRLRLFDVIDLASRLPIYASSAGAMVLTDRIVCFHDHPPYGKDIAQVLDNGFGLVSDLVILPDPRRRVRLLDLRGISRFSRRMAPAHCLALDVGHHVRLRPDGPVTGGAWHLLASGHIDTSWTGFGQPRSARFAEGLLEPHARGRP
jgi:hypothetical protein